MSLQIAANGTRQGVLSHIDSVATEKIPQGTDQAQVDGVKALLASEIASLPVDANGVRIHVEASAHAGGRIIQIQIFPLKLHV